ncbi:MAG: toll/interleukin-1 receptor domain-containing protein [Eggerthellaceae bacterium]
MDNHPEKKDSPYAFVSYSHRDSARVVPLIGLLQDFGMSVWYDEGIEAGSEWPEYIADSLSCAECLIAFITPNSARSHNCRREINFAIAKGIDVVAVYLEPTELSPGLELQLNAFQAVFAQNFDDDRALAASLANARVLQPCVQGLPSAVSDGTDPGEGARQVSEGDRADTGCEETGSQDAPEALTSRSGEAPCQEGGVDEGSGKRVPSAKKRKRILIGAAALAVLLAALAVGVCAFQGGASTDAPAQDSAESGPVESALGDDALAGCWEVVSVEDAGDAQVGVQVGQTVGFVFQGYYFGDAFFLPFSDNDVPGENAFTAQSGVCASDGELGSLDMDDSIGRGDFRILYEVGSLSDGEAALMDSRYRAYYERDQADRLTLHLSGTLDLDLDTSQKLDSTVVLAKRFPVWGSNRMFARAIAGTWNDEYGNTWAFTSKSTGEISFSMVAASGERREGADVRLTVDEDHGYEWVRFSFEEGKGIEGAIDAFDYAKLVLVQPEGDLLTLTRVG